VVQVGNGRSFRRFISLNEISLLLQPSGL